MSATFDRKIHEARVRSAAAAHHLHRHRTSVDKRKGSITTEELPEYQELRTQASAVKKHTIENLDYYLEQFERQCDRARRQSGLLPGRRRGRRFRARPGKRAEARLIVKSKSMTTEEIDFNERLEHHGLESVETDLGEYILQLAHERPYHIVAPALHMTRFQVADIFTKKLGVENETVIEKQAGIARAVLREKFLAADIGVSGANFLVADSGAVVLVENEGNARLTTSAPKIHIAVAGIEKLIPRAQDLATFLKLLGRSATGQPLTVYTSFLSGPRRGRTKSTGRTSSMWCCIDNGRTKLLADREKRRVAVLHPLRRVPEHLPGVPQDRRTLAFRGFIRGRSAPSSRRSSWARCTTGAAVRFQPVRRLRRSLPGEDRHSQGAAGSAVGCEEGAGARRAGQAGAAGVPHLGLGHAPSADLRNGGNGGARRWRRNRRMAISGTRARR